MPEHPSEYLLRVKPLEDGQGYSASIRQLATSEHPDVRAVIGVVSYGKGANPHAAMVMAIANAQIGKIPERGHAA